jgi:hypothetical protein
MSNHSLNWIGNFMWGIAEDTLRDVYVLARQYQAVFGWRARKKDDSLNRGAGSIDKKGKKGCFHQHDDGFASVRSPGAPHGDLLGVRQSVPPPSRVPRRQQWQDSPIFLSRT